MALIYDALQRLMPNGLTLQGKAIEVLQGIAEPIGAAKNTALEVVRESIPGSSVDKIGCWFETLGLAYNPDLTIAEKQAQASAAYTAVGGSSLAYIESQIQTVFPSVDIDEGPTDYEYGVVGDVNTIEDYYRLRGLVQRIASAHCLPTYTIRIIDDLDTAYAGISVTGKAVTGRIA